MPVCFGLCGYDLPQRPRTVGRRNKASKKKRKTAKASRRRNRG